MARKRPEMSATVCTCALVATCLYQSRMEWTDKSRARAVCSLDVPPPVMTRGPTVSLRCTPAACCSQLIFPPPGRCTCATGWTPTAITTILATGRVARAQAAAATLRECMDISLGHLAHVLMPVNTFSQIVLYRVGTVCQPHQMIFHL